MVKVFAANEDMVKYLKHPTTKQGFTDMQTGVNWPNDTFTARRIRDGDVVKDAPAQPKHKNGEDVTKTKHHHKRDGE